MTDAMNAYDPIRFTKYYGRYDLFAYLRINCIPNPKLFFIDASKNRAVDLYPVPSILVF